MPQSRQPVDVAEGLVSNCEEWHPSQRRVDGHGDANCLPQSQHARTYALPTILGFPFGIQSSEPWHFVFCRDTHSLTLHMHGRM